MAMKFAGSADSFKDKLISLGFVIDNITQVQSGTRFDLGSGAKVILFETGSVVAQGKPDAAKGFEDAWNGSPQMPAQRSNHAVPVNSIQERRVFVVHGHDSQAREQLELILYKLGLKSFILQNTAGGGETIIAALEKHISQNAEFGIVLATPDDFGHPASDPTQTRPRARQNVILELGMLLSAVGRKNIAIVRKGDVELPSDLGGVLYLSFTSHVKEVAARLAQRLTESGFAITHEQIQDASM